MFNIPYRLCCCGLTICYSALSGSATASDIQYKTPENFGEDVAFLEKYTDGFLLQKGKAAIFVVPSFQARVMTASADGMQGKSSGWINYKLIASKKLNPHINAFGGEERFWLGPEGGQYAIFFKPGSEFIFDNWQTPSAIDTATYTIKERSDDRALFIYETKLTNWSGFTFDVKIEREISLVEPAVASKELALTIPKGVKAVAYRTANKIINIGNKQWKKETGLLSIWLLGMLKPADKAFVFIPVKSGLESELGRIVNPDYFGPISSNRLQVKRNVVIFRADGKARGKLGINPKRSLGVAGSYDPDAGKITVIKFNQPDNYLGYVNSEWKKQENPYEGDAINSYNDGPLADGSQLGPFYELESSSPAAELGTQQSLEHTQITVHYYGQKEALSKIAKAISGLTIEDMEGVLP